MLKKNRDITPLKGKRSGIAICWGENKPPFWVVQRMVGQQEKMVLSVGSEESALGKKWPFLSLRCGLYNAHLCSPYLPLVRKLKCQTIGSSQSIWFWLLLPLPWFLLVCDALISSTGRGRFWRGVPDKKKKKKKNAEIKANWEVVVHINWIIVFSKWPPLNSMLHINHRYCGFGGMLCKKILICFSISSSKWNKTNRPVFTDFISASCICHQR